MMKRSNSLLFDAYKGYTNEQLLDIYIQGGARIKYLLVDLSEDDMKQLVRGSENWSIYEIVMHVCDAEIMGAARFKQCITQSGREFAFYDQDIWAKKLDYTSYTLQQFEEALELFNLIRKHIYKLLLPLKAEDWKKTAVHQELGDLSLRNILEIYADHSERHIDQIIECRIKLNKSVSINKILSVRLY